MPTVELKNITNHICKDLNLTIEDGEILVLLGRTGAGKTTLLNVIAGLTSYEGHVAFDGVLVDDSPPRGRNVGYLFQDFCLFPHMNVRENIAFGLRARKLKKPQIDKRVNKLLDLFNLEALTERYPNKGLSGGEKQRVALARALAPKPEVLLLDEPFSSLDLATAKHLRLELRKVQRMFGVTTVYVTHNQREASEMSDHIAVINKGIVEQTGTFTEIFFKPRNKKVSDLFGSPNILSCRDCSPLAPGIAKVELNGFYLLVPYDGHIVEKIAISPWNIFISASKPPGPEINRINAIILNVEKKASIVDLEVEAGEEKLNIEMTSDQWLDSGLQPGDKVVLVLPLRWIETKTS